jgi:pimeloyl-ACP methyl ester carboxylesterase
MDRCRCERRSSSRRTARRSLIGPSGTDPQFSSSRARSQVATDFDAFARELAHRLTVHTIERRGRGDSGPQGDDYSIERECEDLAALQAATGATFLFGHSFGGLIALEAARANKAFRKVAVYEPGVSIDCSIDTSWAPACRAQLARGQQPDAFITFARGINPQTMGKAPRWLLKLILPVAIRKREREQKYRLLPAAIREHAEAARLDNTFPHYRNVTADVLLMAGKDATAAGRAKASCPSCRPRPSRHFPRSTTSAPRRNRSGSRRPCRRSSPRTGRRLDDVPRATSSPKRSPTIGPRQGLIRRERNGSSNNSAHRGPSTPDHSSKVAGRTGR